MTTATKLGIVIPAAVGLLVGAAFMFRPKQAKLAAKSVLSVASRARDAIHRPVRVASTRLTTPSRKRR